MKAMFEQGSALEKELRAYLKEQKYSPEVLEATVEDLRAAGQEVREAAGRFLMEEELPNLPCGTVCTVKTLMDGYGMNPIAALLFADLFRKDQQKALRCLARGVDAIVDIPEELPEAEPEPSPADE